LMGKISVIGTGYVGLVSAVGFASLGHKVVGMDRDKNKVEKLKKGEMPFFEEGMEEYLKKALENGNLEFTDDVAYAVRDSKYIFIAVNTPMDEDGSADLSQLLEAGRNIGRFLNSFAIVTVRSTAPVGSLEALEKVLEGEGRVRGRDYELAYNPEFLREGSGIYDFFNPTRIVVGADKREIAEEIMKLYEGINAPKLITSIKDAQLIKYASNAFLAARVSFINEIAAICEAMGADVFAVAEGMGLDPRIGRQYLQPGPGYGGPCLPKDLMALIRMAEENHYGAEFLEAIHKRNEAQKRKIIWKVKEALGGVLIEKTVGVLGLTFKPNTDDVRNSISIPIITKLAKMGARIKAYDPMGGENAKTIFEGYAEIYEDPYKALEGVDVILILTAWNEFVKLDWERIKREVKNPIIIDSVGILRNNRLDGWKVWMVGRGYL
ncbi:MAG: UDP-glucose/GDP-mannose dehydrogenase family protein, partial [candidate division WOR-3 bacterium]